MTELEYIRLSNRTALSHCTYILNDILTGEEYGISDEEYKIAAKIIWGAQNKLFEMLEDVIK